MTNLEANKDKLSNEKMFCISAHICKYGKPCNRKNCRGCEFDLNIDNCIKAMLAEYKEPIKLKQWEKDFLELADYKGYCFCTFGDYGAMKKRGYFKGVIDTDMTIEEILENCEVVE